jgi:hypothetical protein
MTQSTDRLPYIKAAEILDRRVEILDVVERDSDFGPKLRYTILLDGELAHLSLSAAEWRTRAFERMRRQIDSGEPVYATLVQPARAFLWEPYESRPTPPRLAAVLNGQLSLDADPLPSHDDNLVEKIG